MEELLWSDPKELLEDEDDIREVSSRGSGIFFGQKVTETFLKMNNLHTLIRSHELEDDGYALLHNRQCITIFSASYYCGSNDNMGAYITLYDKKPLSPVFHQFRASKAKSSLSKGTFLFFLFLFIYRINKPLSFFFFFYYI
jgi:hypothetical protein